MRIYWHDSYISYKSAYHWSVSLLLVFWIKHSEDLPLRENLWDTVQNTIALYTVENTIVSYTVENIIAPYTVQSTIELYTVANTIALYTVQSTIEHFTIQITIYRSKYHCKKYPSQLNGIPVIIIPLNGSFNGISFNAAR